MLDPLLEGLRLLLFRDLHSIVDDDEEDKFGETDLAPGLCLEVLEDGREEYTQEVVFILLA